MTDGFSPRLRMFAGPNGSGKTSLLRSLAKEFTPNGAFHVHHYVNADDLQAALSSSGVDFAEYEVQATRSMLAESLARGGRLQSGHPTFASAEWTGTRLRVPECDAYTAAAVADFLREELLAARRSLTFETVMSHRNKVEYFHGAAEAGFRTYLYFVATRDPQLNVSRIKSRVELGGHSVPEEKVVARYYRSLENLPDALRIAHRAFLFDNSEGGPQWIAERLPDGEFVLQVAPELLPEWLRAHVKIN